MILTRVLGLPQSTEIDKRPDQDTQERLLVFLWLQKGAKTSNRSLGSPLRLGELVSYM